MKECAKMTPRDAQKAANCRPYGINGATLSRGTLCFPRVGQSDINLPPPPSNKKQTKTLAPRGEGDLPAHCTTDGILASVLIFMCGLNPNIMRSTYSHETQCAAPITGTQGSCECDSDKYNIHGIDTQHISLFFSTSKNRLSKETAQRTSAINNVRPSQTVSHL